MKISFEIGDRVIHKRYGFAQVVNVTVGSQGTTYTIKANGKKIRCSKASLTILKNKQ